MKIILRSFSLMVLLMLAVSCSDNITDLNSNPKAYQSGTVPADAFFSNATRNLVDAVTYGFTFKIIAQQFAQTTYFDASAYNLVDVGSGFWVSLYRDVLLDYKEAKMVLTNKPSLYPAIDKNKLAILEIMQVYVFSTLVNTYGNVPYYGALNTALKSEALDPDNLTPQYDDAAAIYDDLFARLDAAITSLDPASASFGTADLIYAGDVASWKLFANSLKLKMAMTLADVNSAKSKTEAEKAAAAGVFTSNDDNAKLIYLATTPNTNPIWVNLIQSGREDYVASNTMMDLMQAPKADDPRIPLFFTKDNAGGYTGGIYGRSNSYVTFSKAGPSMTAETNPGILIDYTEVQFYLAEAAERGYTVGGAAANFYKTGIEASILYWGGTTADAAKYIADPDVAYATAIGATSLQKIARQKYLAMFNRGLEAWTEYRRLDYPNFNAPPVPQGVFPVRYTYPNSEQTSNIESYTAAATAIGSDKLTTKVFWDVK